MIRTRVRRRGEGDGCGLFALLAVGLLAAVGVYFWFAGANGGNGAGVPVLRPAVPVVVTFRSAVLGRGNVAVVSNQSSARLTLFVCCRRGASGPEKTFTLDLPPNGRDEVGWMEGWAFAAGDTIELTHPDYSSKTVTAP